MKQRIKINGEIAHAQIKRTNVMIYILYIRWYIYLYAYMQNARNTLYRSALALFAVSIAYFTIAFGSRYSSQHSLQAFDINLKIE